MAQATEPQPEEGEEQSNGKVPEMPDTHVAVSLKQADEVRPAPGSHRSRRRARGRTRTRGIPRRRRTCVL